MKTSHTQVLIVGGGPVGLSLAIELGLRGVKCILVERRDGSIPLPKMNGVNARSMEYCRRWGIVDRIRSAGWPVDYPRRMIFCTGARGRILRQIDMGAMKQPRPDEPAGTTPEPFLRCTQQWFDPILRERATEIQPNALRYRMQLERFVDKGDKVFADIKHAKTGETETIIADYLVGCDGANSTVREALGIPMDGDERLSHEVNIFFESFGVFAGMPERKSVMSWLIGPKGMWGALSVVDGRRLWRLWMSGLDSKIDPATFDAESYVKAAIGEDVPFDIAGVLQWDRKAQVARNYQCGRVFLCGDSIHTLTPTGGFGMNTGISDAVDLGWKIAAVFDGWGGEKLLDSYEIERRPVAVRNVDEATNSYNRIMSMPTFEHLNQDGSQGESERHTLVQHLMSGQYEREYRNEGIALGFRYDPSPICIQDGTPAPLDEVMEYQQIARPGSRAPHTWLKDGRSTLDLFGQGFVLLRIGVGAPLADALVDAARQRQVPMQVIELNEPEVVQLYLEPLVLVRPDGHVAWRGRAAPQNCLELIDIVRGAQWIPIESNSPEIYEFDPTRIANK